MLEIVNYNRDEYDFPALVVLGCFDAIHVGHAELLKKAALQAKINGLDLGVMMFAEGKGGRQVFTFEERLAMLEAYKAKFVLKIDYTEDFKNTSAADFLKKSGLVLSYRTMTERIVNREGTGWCPMESAVLLTDDAEEGYLILKEKLTSMKQ